MSTKLTVLEIGTLINVLSTARTHIEGGETLFNKLCLIRTELQLVEQREAQRRMDQLLPWEEIERLAAAQGKRIGHMPNNDVYVYWPDGYKCYCVNKHEVLEILRGETAGNQAINTNIESPTKEAGHNV
jgi:hypothetical protein